MTYTYSFRHLPLLNRPYCTARLCNRSTRGPSARASLLCKYRTRSDRLSAICSTGGLLRTTRSCTLQRDHIKNNSLTNNSECVVNFNDIVILAPKTVDLNSSSYINSPAMIVDSISNAKTGTRSCHQQPSKLPLLARINYYNKL